MFVFVLYTATNTIDVHKKGGEEKKREKQWLGLTGKAKARREGKRSKKEEEEKVKIHFVYTSAKDE